MLKIKQFRDMNLVALLEQTIKWNAIGNLGEHNFSDQRKKLQQACLEEEVKELRDAIAREDAVEMLDALCDMLFVAIYAVYLQKGGDINLGDSTLTWDSIDLKELSGLQWEKIYDTFEEYVSCMDYEGICVGCIGIGMVLEADFKGAYENVVESNFSKFPKAEDVKIGAELAWFETLSKYNDVCYEEHDGRLIFRCDGGYGKIVKPRTFIEPRMGDFIYE